MPTLSSISKDEIDLLKQSGLDHKKSEILCRMGIFSYLETEADIRQALGDEWSELEVWVDDNIDNQGFVAWCEGVVVVSFRGSNLSWGDWSKNAKAFFPERHLLGGRRHNGFHEVWLQKAKQVINILNNKVSAGSQLWLTGHSLGGAIATAAAAEFISNRPSKITEDYCVMTFGAPRYGNEDFQLIYDTKMKDHHWFYVNQRDPVPHLGPAWMGYRHAGDLKYFSKSGDHIDVSKEQVGLQTKTNSPIDLASQNLQVLDDEIDKFSQSQSELDNLVESIMNQAVEQTLTLTDEGVFIDESLDPLQGDSLWAVSSHYSALYWERINSLT